MSQKSTRSGPPIVVSSSGSRKIKKESGVLELPFNNKYDDDDHGAAANFPQSCSSKKTTNDNNKVNNNGRPLLVYKRKRSHNQNQNERVFKKSKVIPSETNTTKNGKGEHSNSNYSKSVVAEAVAKGEWKSSSKYVPGNGTESNACHQCKASKKGCVVKCNRCERKRYCVPCMTRWYPKMSEEDFAKACPVCCNNCNCTVCLRKEVPLQGRRSFYLESSEEVEYSKYVLQALLPFMKQFNEEQMMEKEMEAKIQGLSLSDIKLQGGRLSLPKHIYCNNCKTSIVDLHRSCPQCSYDLCLICCVEIREGHLQGGEQEVINSEYKSKSSKQSRKWDVLENAIIVCPPEAMGGCGQGILELKHIFPKYFVSKLLVKVESIAKAYKLEDKHEAPVQIDISKEKLRRAASREDSCDNYLYCPFAAEIQPENLKHFQCHWFKGEPVIVSNVLETTYGLSWEPMVIWRVLRQISNTNNSKPNDLNIINCSYWRKVNMNIQRFLKGYLEGEFDHRGRLQILKMEEWPPSGSFKEWLPRHGVEFMSCLPFKEYTHPLDGYLNIAAKLPEEISFEPDLGPKMHIGYGVAQELEYGDSITMLHYDMSDTVNVLMHNAAVMTLTSGELVQIEKLREKHNGHDQIDFFEAGNMNQMVEKHHHHHHHGAEIVNSGQQNISDASEIVAVTNVDLIRKESSGPTILGNSFEGYEHTEGGALWDIFRRQDVPKLEEYLKKHFLEFRHIEFSPLRLVVRHQMVYLTMEHKRKLKMEYGIEPWTFVQKLGDAVFIPVGCPYQVRNLKSCINVALGFVSPENLDECIRLTNECRVLPRNHRAKKDKLKVKSMALHAMREAVETLKMDDDDGDEEDDKEPNLCSNDVDGNDGDEDDMEPNLRSGDVDGEEEEDDDDDDDDEEEEEEDDDDDDDDEEEELRAEALGEDIALPPVVKVEPSDTTTTPAPAAPTDTATRPGVGVPDASTSRPRMALWEDHMVLESYVDLLSHMKREHPETFRNDTIRSASMQTYALNLLGEAYVSFAKKPMDTMDAKDIAQFRDLFSDLEQCFKFNVNWLQERVDRIEEVRFKNTRVGGELVPLRLCIEARERELAQLKARYQAKTEEVRDAHKRAAVGLLIGWTPQ